MSKRRCHDCGVQEGELHHPGCDMERCPFCGYQLITCECCFKLLNIDVSPGTWAYWHGLTEAQEQQWDEMLRAKGLVPFIIYPNRSAGISPWLCARCGTLWPDMFHVETAEWEKYVQIDQRDKILCRKCYDEVKRLIDRRNK